MNLRDGRLVTSPTDLANFLTCRHKTALDLLVAEGTLSRPDWNDPFAAILRERGALHEATYVDALRADGLVIVEIPEDAAPHDRLKQTRDAMGAGADVIVQAALGNDEWFGYADVLRKVEAPSPVLGAWSYEAHDTKLTRETKSGTILQLCVYSELIGAIQGVAPERFAVVTPVRHHVFRLDDFAAFHRQVKARLREFLAANTARTSASTYPDPVDHCVVCRWSSRCRGQMRTDDHLSFVAGLGRAHRVELAERRVQTLASLAAVPLPLPFKPSRGSKETYERLREQARLQFEHRESGRPVFEMLPVQQDAGLCMLPEPRPGDLFIDLEGDPFGRLGPGLESGDGTREYLFGLGRVDANGMFQYRARWAFNDAEERAAFDAVMTEIVTSLDADPAIHVFHYAPYEPSAFKRLAGRYATRGTDLDRLLRGGRFVDLYALVSRALRAGVERYSIKNLEPFYAFTREVPLDEAGDRRRLVELALETGDAASIQADTREAVEGYNRDDCRSTWALRDWLERLRADAIARGHDLPRPALEPGTPTESVKARDQRAMDLRAALLDGIPDAVALQTAEHRARRLLAYLVDFHRREERVAWGEYHRTREKSVDDLVDEPTALVGLTFVERVLTPSGKKKAAIDRYAYPAQECDIRVDDQLNRPNDDTVGTVAAIDRAAGRIDIKKRVDRNDEHPDVVIAQRIVGSLVQETSIQRLAAQVIADGLDAPATPRVAASLLARRTPTLRSAEFAQAPGEMATAFAVRVSDDLEESVLSIQGPPGSGKTYTGSQMIVALVAAGRRVGVIANSHKVIRKLLVDAGKASRRAILLAHKPGEDPLPAVEGVVIDELPDNQAARAWLAQPGGRVLGGTAWMWAREEFAGSVDVLFVDEAGQMSLASAVAVAPAARSLVLLGDPQQLDQPRQGSHPDDVDLSVLDHMLGGHQTIPDGQGIFLPTTWRLAPAICDFTSEMFYERKLASKGGLERQRIVGSARFDGAGLLLVPLDHDGCRNASVEEADEVARIVADLLAPGVEWIDEHDVRHQMTAADVLIVAPYNAHVNLLRERVGLPERIGTVDKFQGQEAAVAIYSLATSRPEDAPRGMEFLYSLNRLNVATSRARCRSIVVASARLLEPACRTPRQMQLANALARAGKLSIG